MDGKLRKIDPSELDALYAKEEAFKEVPTLEEWLLYWLKHYILPTCAPSTYANFRSYCSSHILPVLGDYLLTELDAVILQYYVNKKLKCGRLDEKGGLSVKTVKEHINMLNTSLKRALQMRIITVNPCLSIVFPKEVKQQVNVLPRPEEKKLCDEIDPKWMPNSNLPVLISLNTGMRIGEVSALRIHDVDFQKNIINVDESYNRTAVFDENGEAHYPLMYGPTKNKRSRTVPMNSTLKHSLKQYMDTMPASLKADSDAPLFTNRKGNAIEPRAINKHFQKLLHSLNIENIHFHCLRHTFATKALELGMNMKYCSAILGHSHTGITENLYAHATGTQLQIEMQRFDQAVSPL